MLIFYIIYLILILIYNLLLIISKTHWKYFIISLNNPNNSNKTLNFLIIIMNKYLNIKSSFFKKKVYKINYINYLLLNLFIKALLNATRNSII